MTAPAAISRVVVAGRDAPLWLCAAAIRRGLGSAGVQVVAVELPSQLAPGDVIATLPPLGAFHAKLRLDEAALLRATRGSVSFGQNVVDKRGASKSFFHAWGAYGTSIDEHPFFPCWLRARREGWGLALENYCPDAVAAKSGRMWLPDAAMLAFGRSEYGYHLPALAYAGYLKALAASLGIKMHEAREINVERGENGIAALIADGELRVEGELFVDATGGDATLIGQALGVALESWRRHFPVDRLLRARAPTFTSIPAFAETRVETGGWTSLHPSRSVTGVVRAFSSDRENDDAALEGASAVARTGLSDIAFRSVNPGRRSEAWVGNCVAVGESACALDPVHDCDLQVLQLGVVHLLSLFPVSETFAIERKEYNRLMRSCCERICDFQAAFYVLAPYEGAFWDDARGRAMPTELVRKVSAFGARAAIPPMEDETFFEHSWQALLSGLGLEPETWPPAIDGIAPERLKERLNGILTFIKQRLGEQPTHDAYLASISGSAA